MKAPSRLTMLPAHWESLSPREYITLKEHLENPPSSGLASVDIPSLRDCKDDDERAMILAMASSPKSRVGEGPLGKITGPLRRRMQRLATAPCQRAPIAEAGRLGHFPFEVLTALLLSLDMQTLFKLRQVNRWWRQTILDLPAYHAVVNHGIDALCVLLKTQLISRVSLADFFLLLCTDKCAVCGHFGNRVFLPTWIRCCSFCLSESTATQVFTLSFVRRILNLNFDFSRSSKLRICRTNMWCCYGLDMESSRHPVSLVARTEVLPDTASVNRLTKKLGQFGHVAEDVLQNVSRGTRPWRAGCRLPYFDRRSKQLQTGVQCRACLFLFHHKNFDIRFLSVSNAGSAQIVEDSALTRSYSDASFPAHVRQCKFAPLYRRVQASGYITNYNAAVWLKNAMLDAASL